MPKSAFLVFGRKGDLRDVARLACAWDWAQVDSSVDAVRITMDDGATILLEPAPFDWEWRPTADREAAGPSGLWALLATCRSELLVAKVAKSLAPAFDERVWIVDDSPLPIPAATVDPQKLQL